jgi:hypothetical protein
MTRIILDADMRMKLLGVMQPLELCDESGQVLGRVIPTIDRTKIKGAEPEISEEELQRRENEPGEYTTAEVLAYLEKL